MKTRILAVAFLLPSTLAWAQSAPAQSSIDAFFESLALEWTRGDPQQATLAQTFEGATQDSLDRQLTPVTDDHRDARTALARRAREELRQFDRAQLTPRQRLHADLLDWQLDNQIRADAVRDFSFPLEQFNGVHVALVAFLTKIHPLRNPRDAGNYLARLEQIGPRIDDACAVAEARAARGFLPPRFIFTTTIRQMERFLSPEPGQNILVRSFADRVAALPGCSQKSRGALVASAEKLVGESVLPACRRALTLLQRQQSAATDDAGLCRFKGGDAAYACHLRNHTSTLPSSNQTICHRPGL